MSLAHTLIDSALAADLTQNELKIFLVLLRQTLCFGKSSDALTTKRIAVLAHIRKDRVPTAIKGLLQPGLFQIQPHPRYETEYSINESLLTQHQGQVLAPNLPKNRKPTQPTEALPEKRVHTTKTSTIKTHTTEQRVDVLADTLPYPKTFTPPQRQQAAQLLDGLTPTQAHNCLTLLNQALYTKTILKPLAYLHQLIKAARNGTLDTSTLVPTITASSTTTNVPERLKQLAQEIYGLDQLFKRAGIPLDNLNSAKREKWIQEYQSLKSTLMS